VNFSLKLGMFKKGLTYDTVMILFSLFVPLCMFLSVPNESNPYMDKMTPWLVLIISVAVVLTIKLNQRLLIPLLDVFILVYLIFWHLRFLTLSFFPQYELVLTRTVDINSESFNSYTLVVFGAFLSVVAGFSMMHKYLKPHDEGSMASPQYVRKNNPFDFSLNFYVVLIYALICIFFYAILVPYFTIKEQGVWLGYLGIFFNTNILMFLLFMLILSKGIGIGKKLVAVVSLILFVLVILALGSRSAIVTVLLAFIILKLILRQKPRFSYRDLLVFFVLALFMFISFFYATFLRDYRQSDGFLSKKSIEFANQQFSRSLTLIQCNVTRYIEGTKEYSVPNCKRVSISLGQGEGVEERSARKGSPEALLGLAFARAGYLDFSAGMYLNDNYNKALNMQNIGKSIIDNSVPGMFFDDSRRIEHRIRDVYNPEAVGYQSDAIGFVGENYRLFNSWYPIAIFLFASVLLALFSMFKGTTIIGLYCQYTLGWAVVYWCNSYGYDTLVLDIGRQLLMGIVVLAVITRVKPKKVCARLGKRPL